jgi:hypothetical protein
MSGAFFLSHKTAHQTARTFGLEEFRKPSRQAHLTISVLLCPVQVALVNWHNQLLRSYLHRFQAQFPDMVSHTQHEQLQSAKLMRAKADRAADAASNFPQPMAHSYLTTNLQAICNCDRSTAEGLLQEHGWDISAAVNSYIKNTMVPALGLPFGFDLDKHLL